MTPTIHDRSVMIDYTNHRGERSLRRVVPVRLDYGAAPPWHTEPQWLLTAYDLDKKGERTFALRNVLAWGHGPATPPTPPVPAPGPTMGPASWAAFVAALLSLGYAAARGPCPRAGLASLGAGVLLVTAGAALWPGRP